MRNNSKGFTLVEALLVVLVLCVIGFGVFYVMRSGRDTTTNNESAIPADSSRAESESPEEITNAQPVTLSGCEEGIYNNQSKESLWRTRLTKETAVYSVLQECKLSNGQELVVFKEDKIDGDRSLPPTIALYEGERFQKKAVVTCKGMGGEGPHAKVLELHYPEITVKCESGHVDSPTHETFYSVNLDTFVAKVTKTVN